MCRPLLKISSGELDGPGSKIEERLAEVFLLATRWTGIALLDEADVFMQERTLQDLERNQLVSSEFPVTSPPLMASDQ